LYANPNVITFGTDFIKQGVEVLPTGFFQSDLMGAALVDCPVAKGCGQY
jgi:hypothetical protein